MTYEESKKLENTLEQFELFYHAAHSIKEALNKDLCCTMEFYEDGARDNINEMQVVLSTSVMEVVSTALTKHIKQLTEALAKVDANEL